MEKGPVNATGPFEFTGEFTGLCPPSGLLEVGNDVLAQALQGVHHHLPGH